MTRLADPILYSFRRCPYAMRARLALAISGAALELREVKLSARPAAMLEASPKGTVPVLVLADGAVIDESIDIMHWALAQADPEGWQERTDPELIAQCDGQFKHTLDRTKYPDRHGADPLEHREQGLMFLRQLDGRLSDKGQLCGPTRGLADAAIMPFVRQFAAIDPDWFAVQSLPQLKTWLEGHLASPLFAVVMQRCVPWSPGDAPVTFASGTA